MTSEFLWSREYLWWLFEGLSVDHDNTVCDTKGLVTREFNREFGTSHHALEISRWGSLIEWAQALGKSYEEALGVNHKYWYNEDLINQASPNLGALEFLGKVKHLKPIINSSRPFAQRATTVKWYEQHAPFIPPEQIIVGLPDIVVSGDAYLQGISKVYVINLLRLRSHIEDVTLHAKLVLDNTDASVFFLSDDPSLDREYSGRLMRFGSINGGVPDFTGLNELIRG